MQQRIGSLPGSLLRIGQAEDRFRTLNRGWAVEEAQGGTFLHGSTHQKRKAYMTIALENKLWADFISGEPSAFRALYDGYSTKLYAYGCRYTTDTGLVMDCVHDLFVDLHRYQANLDPDARVTAYLFSSLRRKVQAALAKRQRYQMLGDTVPENDLFTVDWTPENQLIHNETETQLATQIAQALRALPGRQQEALYLRFSEGMAYADVASVLGVSIPSCRTLVYRAVKSLRGTVENVPLSPMLFLLFARQGS